MKRVKNRNRLDVKFFYRDGASLRFTSDPSRSLSYAEMIKELGAIIVAIERAQSQVEPVAVSR